MHKQTITVLLDSSVHADIILVDKLTIGRRRLTQMMITGLFIPDCIGLPLKG